MPLQHHLMCRWRSGFAPVTQVSPTATVQLAELGSSLQASPPDDGGPLSVHVIRGLGTVATLYTSVYLSVERRLAAWQHSIVHPDEDAPPEALLAELDAVYGADPARVAYIVHNLLSNLEHWQVGPLVHTHLFQDAEPDEAYPHRLRIGALVEAVLQRWPEAQRELLNVGGQELQDLMQRGPRAERTRPLAKEAPDVPGVSHPEEPSAGAAARRGAVHRLTRPMAAQAEAPERTEELPLDPTDPPPELTDLTGHDEHTQEAPRPLHPDPEQDTPTDPPDDEQTEPHGVRLHPEVGTPTLPPDEGSHPATRALLALALLLVLGVGAWSLWRGGGRADGLPLADPAPTGVQTAGVVDAEPAGAGLAPPGPPPPLAEPVESISAPLVADAASSPVPRASPKQTQCWMDKDQDGYLAEYPFEQGARECKATNNKAEDCDDEDKTTHPKAERKCNDRDNDCDGEPDCSSKPPKDQQSAWTKDGLELNLRRADCTFVRVSYRFGSDRAPSEVYLKPKEGEVRCIVPSESGASKLPSCAALAEGTPLASFTQQDLEAPSPKADLTWSCCAGRAQDTCGGSSRKAVHYTR